MARPIRISIIGDDKKFRNTMGRVEGSLGGLVGRIGGVATAIGGLAAGAGLARFGLDAIGVATDVAESQSKVTNVFGESADAIEENSRRSAQALGIARGQYLDFAGTVGAALTSSGASASEASELTGRALQNFADLASFHNSTAEEVSGAWDSAMRGSFEPIQRYMPFISGEFIKTYGISQGLIAENTEQLNAHQRAIILDAIAMDETLNPAYGDFAETSDGLANQQRILAASFEDVKGRLGTQLLPVALRVAEVFSTFILPAFERVGGAVFGLLAPALGEAVGAIRTFISIWGNTDDGVTSGGLPGAIERFAIYTTDNVFPILQELGARVQENVIPALRNFADFITGTLIPAWQTVAVLFAEKAIPIITAIAGVIVETVIPGIQDLAGFIANELVPRVVLLATTIAESAQPTIEAFALYWTEVLKPNLETVITVLRDGVAPVLLAVADVIITKLVPFILEHLVPTLLELVVMMQSHVAPALRAVVDFVIEHVVPALILFVDWIGTIIENADEFARSVVEKFDSVVAAVRGMPGRISAAASGMWDGIRDSFRSAINWVIDKWNSLSFTLPSAEFLGQTIGGGSISTPNIDRFMYGTNYAAGGLSLVGEAGPELVNLPRGASVTPAHRTSNAGQGDINVYVTNPHASAAEIGDALGWALRTGGR